MKHNDDMIWMEFALPKREEAYNRERALLYWFNLSIDDAIYYLSGEMFSSSGFIRLGINMLGAVRDKDKIMLFESGTSLAKFQRELLDLYRVVYELIIILSWYETNRRKILEDLSKENALNILSTETMKFPENLSENYLALLPDWYQQTPDEFTSIVMPLLETSLSQLGDYIKKFDAESDENNFSLGLGELTLRIVTCEMARGFKILDEEFFLLKSCANRICK